MGKFSVGDRVDLRITDTIDDPGTVVATDGVMASVIWDSFESSNVIDAMHYRVDLLDEIATSNLVGKCPAEINTDGLAGWERALLVPAETLESLSFASQVDSLLQEVGDMLKAKNAAYGDAALTPLRVFSKLDNAAGIRVRLDDKLSRIARGDGSGDEDAVKDLLGYVILLRIAEAAK